MGLVLSSGGKFFSVKRKEVFLAENIFCHKDTSSFRFILYKKRIPWSINPSTFLVTFCSDNKCRT